VIRALASVPDPDAGKGEPLTVEQIYDRYFPFVWRSLQHLGVTPQQLDDAAQDVFVVVFNKLDDFEGRSSLKTWIFGIVHLIALSYFRREQRAQQHDPLLNEIASRQRGPGETLGFNEDAAFLQSVLDTLDEGQRAAFVMADIEEMTAPEISAALGVKLNTVYSRVRLARRALARALERHRGKP
jgi:RNA polymerase sigma-70 factor (ECF subfamily)